MIDTYFWLMPWSELRLSATSQQIFRRFRLHGNLPIDEIGLVTLSMEANRRWVICGEIS